MDRNEIDEILATAIDIFVEDENFMDLVAGLVGCITGIAIGVGYILPYVASKMDAEAIIDAQMDCASKLLESARLVRAAAEKIVKYHESSGDSKRTPDGSHDRVSRSGQDDAREGA